jgi:hypothetical protein
MEIIVPEHIVQLDDSGMVKLLKDSNFRFEFGRKSGGPDHRTFDNFAHNKLLGFCVDGKFDFGKGAAAEIAPENGLPDPLGVLEPSEIMIVDR